MIIQRQQRLIQLLEAPADRFLAGSRGGEERGGGVPVGGGVALQEVFDAAQAQGQVPDGFGGGLVEGVVHCFCLFVCLCWGGESEGGQEGGIAVG